MVQKWLFKDLFWDLRLGDTVIAATQSHRQMEVTALVMWSIKKINSIIAEKAIMGPIYNPT